MTNFVSVSTSAARFQDISLNPQKLAGQCAKLKCCLNYEVDAYVESQKRLPSKEITLETAEGTYYFFKADILKGLITYSTDKSFLANAVTITARNAFEVINMNKRGEKPESLIDTNHVNQKPIDLVEQESLTRFDKRKNNNTRKKKKRTTPTREVNKEESKQQTIQKEPKQAINEPQSKENPPRTEKGKNREFSNRGKDDTKTRNKSPRKPNGNRERPQENASGNPNKNNSNEKEQANS